jgi:hypothetical protein
MAMRRCRQAEENAGAVRQRVNVRAKNFHDAVRLKKTLAQCGDECGNMQKKLIFCAIKQLSV